MAPITDELITSEDIQTPDEIIVSIQKNITRRNATIIEACSKAESKGLDYIQRANEVYDIDYEASRLDHGDNNASLFNTDMVRAIRFKINDTEEFGVLADVVFTNDDSPRKVVILANGDMYRVRQDLKKKGVFHVSTISERMKNGRVVLLDKSIDPENKPFISTGSLTELGDSVIMKCDVFTASTAGVILGTEESRNKRPLKEYLDGLTSLDKKSADASETACTVSEGLIYSFNHAKVLADGKPITKP